MININNKYFKEQIITYMGNKRKILNNIDNAIKDIIINDKDIADKYINHTLNLGEGFSGSGIVSRLLCAYESNLFVNDIASYSTILSECFLSSYSIQFKKKLEEIINIINDRVDNDKTYKEIPFIQKYWAPSSNNIQENERVFFTHENGIRIDRYRQLINEYPSKYKNCLLSILLIECSIKNNTTGHFSAYLKKDGIGHYGGKNDNDLNRITSKIILYMPTFYKYKHKQCKPNIKQMNVFEWINTLPKMDIVYYDPPYNKHSYSIYYFLLDIIVNYDVNMKVPNTYRGQPKNWIKSSFNSISNAKKSFEKLIKDTNSKYIIVSYNKHGIISLQDIISIMKRYGSLNIHSFDHKTYNRLKGVAKYKKFDINFTKDSNEYIFILQK